jgi:hypothetical protein
MVGDSWESAVAALKARGVAYSEEPGGTRGNRRIVYSRGAERVTLEFASPDARPVLRHIRSVAPGSDERRSRVRSLEKDGQRWAYETSKTAGLRSAAERARYPVCASLQWRPGAAGPRTPAVTFLFQAARPVGTKPGGEETVFDAFLEDANSPRRP